MREEEIYAALKAAFPGMDGVEPGDLPADADPATRTALDAVPGIEAWGDLSPAERERRERILAARAALRRMPSAAVSSCPSPR